MVAGRIVEGHGDLRPEHIYLGTPPAIIDRLEFSMELRTLDTLALQRVDFGYLVNGTFGEVISQADTTVLLSLAAGDRHGYGIILRVEEWTGGRIRLKTGTLYTALGRLREAGWIEESDDVAEGDDERRRYYRLTAAGRAVVHDTIVHALGKAAKR
mgnify:CR=1 FL=1